MLNHIIKQDGIFDQSFTVIRDNDLGEIIADGVATKQEAERLVLKDLREWRARQTVDVALGGAAKTLRNMAVALSAGQHLCITDDHTWFEAYAELEEMEEGDEPKTFEAYEPFDHLSWDDLYEKVFSEAITIQDFLTVANSLKTGAE